MKMGISGFLTKSFIHSPLTPLLLVAALVLGIVALVGLSREEEPQISVPMVDIFVQVPGKSAADVLQLAGKPLEEIISSVNGVEHVYTQVADNRVMITARFLTGTDEDDALLRIHEKIRANYNRIPYGVTEPLVVGHGINDVAVITLTLSPKPSFASNWNEGSLYAVAQELNSQLTKVKDIGLTYSVGGAPDEIRVIPNLEKLNLYNIGIDQLTTKLEEANRVLQAGNLNNQGKSLQVVSGISLSQIEDLGNLLLTSHGGKPIYVADVATLSLSPKLQDQRVWNLTRITDNQFSHTPAVTLAIAKRKGANAIDVTDSVLEQVKELSSSLLPESLEVTVTRNYGETANTKANELLFHLALATLSIVALIALLVGKRPGLVVFIVIPVTILLTLFAAYIMGYTINRVSLFALIFAIGILVDDAIVVVENIHRHWSMKDKRSATQAAIDAVAEVGNPTIVATLTVVVALLPMMFVSGMMGPYMSPIPAIASLAMVFSFFVAVVLTPWLMVRIDRREDAVAHHTHAKEDKLAIFYRQIAKPILQSPRTAKRFLVICGVATLACFAFFPLKLVTVKLLPFDNKSELQVVADLPQGSSLEDTERTLLTAADLLRTVPEITSMQIYAGTASPFNFNGLVRHSFLRNNSNQGDISINLLSKEDRSRASHAIAVDIRERLKSLTLPPETRLKVVEVPPGPPVLSTLLAEVYGPDAATRRAMAEKVKESFHKVDFIVDIDDTFPTPAKRLRFIPNEANLEYYGVNRDLLSSTLKILLNGQTVGHSQRPNGGTPLEINVQLDKSTRTLNENLLATPISARNGTVELGDLGSFVEEDSDWPIFRRNGRTAEMVMAELAGRYEAPIYGMGAVSDAMKEINWNSVPQPKIKLVGQPENETKPTLLWDGEWEITATTFTDMGIAFAIALMGIYLLVVAQFGSFKLPVVVLLPVPLSLLGIVLGHAMLMANFTAPSMIGFIALAGIIVRNSILLVDFIRIGRKPGQNQAEILLEAGAIRFKPILLTALAAIIGAVFIITDPIFQGLAISLIFGLISSTALTLLAVPAVYVIYYNTGLSTQSGETT